MLWLHWVIKFQLPIDNRTMVGMVVFLWAMGELYGRRWEKTELKWVEYGRAAE